MNLVSAEYNRHTGLGNKLFSWSRAKIFAAQHSWLMLQYFWFSPRGAAISRGGIDFKRALKKIWLFDNFVKDKKEIAWLEYYFRYKDNLKIIKVDNLFEAKDYADYKEVHLQFKWDKSHNFLDLQGYSKNILDNLYSLVSYSDQRFISKYANQDFIGINVRSGNDFIEPDSEKDGHRKTSLQWFEEGLEKIRDKYSKLPVLIISDGGPKQLSSLLKLENVSLLDSTSAIADLLILTKAKILLGSGNSTFSAWASFLGQMATYSSKETPFEKFYININSTQNVNVL